MAGSSSEDYLDKLLAGVTENSPASGEDDLDALLNKAEHPEEAGLDASLNEAEHPEEKVDVAEAASVFDVSTTKKSVAEAIRESLSEKKEEPDPEPEKVEEKKSEEKPAIIEVSDEEAQDEADDLLALLTDDPKDEKKVSSGNQETKTVSIFPTMDLDDEDEAGEDIEAMLAKAEAEGNASAKKDIEAIENADMDDLIGAASSDMELAALGDMLHKSDDNILLDKNTGAIPENVEELVAEPAEEGKGKKKKEKKKKKKKGEEAQGEGDASQENAETEDEKPKKKKRFGKKAKAADVVADENSGDAVTEMHDGEATGENAAGDAEGEAEETAEQTEKKPGFFKKLLNLLTEEVEDEEADGEGGTSAKGAGLAEEEQLKLSDENKAVLEAVDGEGDEGKGKKGKKEKKEKAPKEKKVKPKKEKIKKPKPEETEADKRKKLPKKYVTGNIFLAISIIVALLLINSYLPNIMLLKEGRDAFYSGDYHTAFLTMYGKDLNEGDQILYDKAKTIVILERKYESHQNYERMNLPYEALSVLFEGLEKYDRLLIKAESLGIEKDLNVVKDKIVNELLTQYGVSEAQAREILTYSPIDYHAKLESILYGTPFEKTQDRIFNEVGAMQNVVVEEESPEENEQPTLEDMLPEEEEYLQQTTENGFSEEELLEVLPEENADDGTPALPQDTMTGAGAQIGETPIAIQIESEIFE